MSQYDYKKYRDNLRNKRNSSNLCIMCGKEPQRKTSKLGELCHKKSIENRIKLREKRISEGLCGHCLTRKSSEGMKLCIICRDKKRLTGDKKLRKRCLTYGIDENDYKDMLELQNKKCAICFGDPNGRWEELNIDHCHTTGKVRGLLCGPCNKALGCFKDDKDILKNAIKYLEGKNEYA